MQQRHAGAGVLIVEDDEAIGQLLITLCEPLGAPVRWTRTGHAALALAEEATPAVVLLDLGLPGLYGTSVAVTLRARWPALPIIVLSALPPATLAADAWSIGARAYFAKPFDAEQVAEAVQRALAESLLPAAGS